MFVLFFKVIHNPPDGPSLTVVNTEGIKFPFSGFRITKITHKNSVLRPFGPGKINGLQQNPRHGHKFTWLKAGLSSKQFWNKATRAST